MDSLTSLQLALAATRPGPHRRGLARRVERDGPEAISEALTKLDAAERSKIHEEAAALAERGVGALIRGGSNYPHILDLVECAPPALFYQGQLNLLSKPAIGICGSRNVSEDGLRAAVTCGEVAASLGIVSVSGYARGVDTATHIASLKAGGETVAVLPEGIDHFRVKRGAASEAWNPSRALVLSQFAPKQPWTTGGAMTRNGVIIGLSMALVVVEAGEKGGTLAAGTQALRLGRRVLALEFTQTPVGNQMLIGRGAVSVRDRSELATFLDELRNVVDEAVVPDDREPASQEELDLQLACPAARPKIAVYTTTVGGV